MNPAVLTALAVFVVALALGVWLSRTATSRNRVSQRLDRMGALQTYGDSMTKSLTGAIDVRSQALDDTNARLSARINDVDARLDKKRTSLLAQYAKFEASLGRLQSLQSSMTAQFTGLNKSND